MVRKLLFRVILIALFIFSTLASINYMVDPALVLRDGEFEYMVAKAILKKKNVAITTNYNERKLQRFLIQGLNDAPDGIIVGSSRIMNISLDSLGLRKGMCNGMSGAVMEDIISIIGMYESKNILPKSIFIGVDPWLFNDNHGDTRYKELINEYNKFAAINNLILIPNTMQSKNWYAKFEQALSPTYFQASLANIHNRPTMPLITTDILDDYQTRLYDASIVYDKAYRTKTEDEVNHSVVSVINGGSLYHSVNYNQLSSKITNQFTSLIEFLKNKGVHIIFVLTPLHPILYTHIIENPNYKMIIESEMFVRELAKEKGIYVIGSINPNKVDAKNADFYDFMHPTREFMTKLCGDNFYE